MLCSKFWNVRKVEEAISILMNHQHEELRRMLVISDPLRSLCSLTNQTHYFHCTPPYLLLIKRGSSAKGREMKKEQERKTDRKGWWILMPRVTDLQEHNLHPSIMTKTICFFQTNSPWTAKLANRIHLISRRKPVIYGRSYRIFFNTFLSDLYASYQQIQYCFNHSTCKSSISYV